MKHSIISFVGIVAISVAGAQTPPAPPVATTPVTPTRPAPAARPLLPLSPDGWLSDFDREEIRRAAEAARIDGQRMAEEGRRIAEDARLMADQHRIDGQLFAEHARIAALDAVHDLDFNLNFDLHAPAGQRQWVQGDPADSIYQLGRQVMSRYEYSRAAGLFAEVLAKYPNSRRAGEAAYYQAFSLYRVGTLESLRTALKVLESNGTRMGYASEDSRKNEAINLQVRVLRALVDRREPSAEQKLKELTDKYPFAICDSEDNNVRVTLLNSLYYSDPEGAMQPIREALQTRDACRSQLRRTAVSLLGNRPSEANGVLIATVARQDTVRSVRNAAIDQLSRMPGDTPIATLQDLMRDQDEYVQRAAVRALMRSGNARARGALRTALLDQRTAPESQRIEAIQSFDRNNMTPEDAKYLRDMYARTDESERIKGAIISTLARVPTDENVAFLLAIARNTSEPTSLRSRALSSISRKTLTVDDLSKLYDASDSRSMRLTIVEALASRDEEPAVNKLFDIVRFSTDPEVKGRTIEVLLRKKDPAIQKRLFDLIK